MGTCWVTTSWVSTSWVEGSWADGSTPAPFDDGVYFLEPLGGGLYFIKKM